jgi:hypothetical protein
MAPRRGGGQRRASQCTVDNLSTTLTTLSLENGIRYNRHYRSNLQLTVHSKPLTTFHLFPELPPELRFNIWKTACNEPRLIELVTEYKAAEKSRDDFAHNYHRVSSRSSKVPAILHACQESRREASSVYQLRNFAHDFSQTSNLKPALVYFNPNYDTVYFGHGTCMMTMANFFLRLHDRNEEIQRLAILCSGQVLDHCKRNPYYPPSHDPGWINSIINTYTPMELLHGIDKASEESPRAPGCPGLREVSWIVPSMLMFLKEGDVDEYVRLRPAATCGMTESQEDWYWKLDEDMEKVRRGVGLQRLAENKWTGDNIPDFQFMSFSPEPETGMEYDSMSLPRKDAKFLKRSLAQLIEGWTGVEIKVCKELVLAQEEIEIGFYGKPLSIRKAKGCIMGHLYDL